jgi:outer membrane beta-barrel protein
MTKRPIIAFVLGVGLLVGLGLTTESASAQEIQITGPLAGAPACHHCRIHREGRFQLQPTVGFSLQDEYARSIMFGLQINYHITDWLGIGLWGRYSPLDIDTDLTTQVKENGQTSERNVLSLPNAAEFGNQIARFRTAFALQLTFVPLRGKLSLFQELFVDADFYIFAGVAGILVDQRGPERPEDISVSMRPACLASAAPDVRTSECGQVERESIFDVTFTAGVGLMMYVTDWFGLSFEWRALPFAWNTSGTDEKNQDGQTFPDGIVDGNDNIYRLNHMVNIGFAFFLPTTVQITE